MSEWISLNTASGPIRAWHARPADAEDGERAGHKPAVVVIQEIFGVNPHIRAVTDRFAQAGIAALAPAMFDPLTPDRRPQETELNYDDAGVARGREWVAELGFDAAVKIVEACANRLREAGHSIGAVGFCWGGTVAMLANTRLGLPSVSYYGGRSLPFLHEPARAPMLFHFGERDPIIPPEHVQTHRQRHPQATIHVYPAGHGFNCDARRDYDADCAALAWRRSIDFFMEHLR